MYKDKLRQDRTERDDQYELPILLDEIKFNQKIKNRFRLVDSGRFDRSQLEWLLEAGADFYSSDEFRRDPQELNGLQSACQKGKSILAYLINDSFAPEDEEKTSRFTDLCSLGQNGIYLFVSNRDQVRDYSQMASLAVNCRDGGSRLICYVHGALDPALLETARNGAWIHVSDHSLKEESDNKLLLEVLESARLKGANLVLHVDKGLDYPVLRDIIGGGAWIRFKKDQIDYRSPLKELQLIAEKSQLDFRSYYLYPDYLL